MTPINITALRHSAFYSPLLATIAGGFLQREGLEPHYQYPSADDPVPDAIRSGSVHLAQSAVATSFAGLEAGESCDIVHFAQINERDGFFLASREPRPEFTCDDLEGQSVLVDHFFQPMAMLRYGLHKHGVDFSAIDVIDAGNVEEIDAAFRAGRGAFVHQQGPAPQQLEKDGIGYLIAAVGDTVGPVAFSSLCASREWLQTDMAKAFMRAYRRGRQYVIDTPPEEVARIEEGFFPDIDHEVLVATIETYQQLGCWTPAPEISRESYETLLDVFMFSGLITRRHPYESCIVAPPE